MKLLRFSLYSLLILVTSSALAQNRRDTQVVEDKEKVSSDDSWIYNDLEQATKIARSENRPMLIVFR